ncbi:hypothetical protein OPT61_g1353 [Boeremia exigua]|uniref:Uncharacterized protein n=1 Tax=Boeremia exigua TaxID=749465 RepID=A0ACC2IQV2_9PLEO|nr:hypothetical protein OPT61_g1353 [Boeremia exigua]
MKVAIIGATGSIGSLIFRHTLQRDDISEVVAVTRKPLSITDPRVHNAVIPDFGALDSLPDATWSAIQTADALVWAMGTYDINEDVNFTYPLEFQKRLAQRLSESRAREGKTAPFRFILLGGALTETDQSRWLYFLPQPRRTKGLLQTKTLEFAEAWGEGWVAHVIRPGGVLMSDNNLLHTAAGLVLGSKLLVGGQELGAFVADLAVNGSERNVIENSEIVETGRRLIAIDSERS